jgi:beta-glucosidase
MSENKSADAIVGSLKLRQKASLLFGDGDWKTHGFPAQGLGVVQMNDGPCGLRIPEEGPLDVTLGRSQPATAFPAPCLTACSWDPEMMRKLGVQFGLEALDQKTDVVLAPGINIKRNPLCGRNFEYLSEDPYLAGKMAAGFINGIQSEGVGACLKHFAVNSQETRRFTYSAEVDPRALREIYLRGFEIAVKESKPWMIMCCYNKVNGTYGSDNDLLLDTILRKEWGFAGVVVSDWGATVDPVLSHNHGLDLEMPCHEDHSLAIRNAVKAGRLSVKKVDESAKRIVELYQKAAAKKQPDKPLDYASSHELARQVAENSIVLAKNNGAILPLKNYEDTCIIGALADTFRFQGLGSSQVVPKQLVSYLAAARASMGAGKTLAYCPGYSLTGEKNPALALDAVDMASSHQNVILVLGLPGDAETEGHDRKDMRLSEEQYSLFDAIYAQNPNIIVIVLCGSPVELPFAQRARAVVLPYLAGEAGGEALNNVILGKVNPSGHLAESWPIHYLDVPNKELFPSAGDVALYKESIFVGYRYYLSANKKVLFPFGLGLSYTAFKYGDLSLDKTSLTEKGNVSISFTVKNIGKRDGAEVVQLYIEPQNGKVFKAKRELKAFQKVFLNAGASTKVSFSVSFEDFTHYEATGDRFEVENGQYLIEIGSSCEDLRLQAALTVVSAYHAIVKRALIPSYYAVSATNFGHVPDEEFSRLLGADIPHEKLKKSRPYTFNSTLGDLQNTFVGHQIHRTLAKRFKKEKMSEADVKANFVMFDAMPLRFLTLGGVKEKKCLAILDLANHRPVKALFDSWFGRRK